MPLEYPATWKFDGIGIDIPSQAVSDFLDVVEKIASGTENPQETYETFKSAFGVQSWSSSASWAVSDLAGALDNARNNAALFVASFWDGIEKTKRSGAGVPSAQYISKILDKWGIPLLIDPPHLLLKEGDVVFAASESPVEPNTGANSYKRGEVLGKGGFGVVYRVTRTTKAGNFDFAMKVFDPSPFIENRERAEARFVREIQALRKLQHRGIIQHLEAGFDGDQKPYILMPLIEGDNICKTLSGAPPTQVFVVFDEVLNALEWAHGKGVLHRDLKPSNVLVRSSDMQPIILDFGCAYLVDDAEESDLTTTLIGSASYMPIEVFRDPKHRTVKHDIYACGLMLYEVLDGSRPNPEDYKPIDAAIKWRGVDKLVKDAIAPERSRISSASIFRQRLRDVAAGH